jgi:AI-2 transport protein TqsA
MGVPLAVLWGVLSWAFNYIPNVGVFISGIPPTLLAFGTLGWGRGLGFIAGLIVIETLTGDVLAPLIEGRVLPLSPLGVLVALVFWGWMWGAAGALLAVPITMLIVEAMRHAPAARPLGELLSDRSG